MANLQNSIQVVAQHADTDSGFGDQSSIIWITRSLQASSIDQDQIGRYNKPRWQVPTLAGQPSPRYVLRVSHTPVNH